MSSIHISPPILILAAHPSQSLYFSSDALDSSPVGWSCPPPAFHLRLHQGSNTPPAQKTEANISNTGLRFRMYKKST